MDSLQLYQLVVQQLSDMPDLRVIAQPAPCPEAWPLLLTRVETFRGQVQRFYVGDGQREVCCQASFTEVYNKVVALEPGAIIHLVGAQPWFMEEQKGYGLRVEDLLTLREYDALIQKQQRAKQKRQQKVLQAMAEEGYLPPVTEPVTTGAAASSSAASSSSPTVG